MRDRRARPRTAARPPASPRCPGRWPLVSAGRGVLASAASLFELEVTMSDTDVLFQPFRLKGLSLPNRIVMAPMTRSKSPGQIPNETVAAYYRARAEGGVGLILTEGTSPEHKSASNDVNVPAFFGEDSLERLGERAQGGEGGGRSHHAAALASGHRASRGLRPVPRRQEHGTVGPLQARQAGRRADERQRDCRCDCGLRQERGLRQGPRLRRRRAPRRARLHHRRVLLGRHQPARRQIRRQPGEAHQLRRRRDARGA